MRYWLIAYMEVHRLVMYINLHVGYSPSLPGNMIHYVELIIYKPIREHSHTA